MSFREQIFVLASVLVLVSTASCQLGNSNPTLSQARVSANIVNNAPTVQNKIYNKMVNPNLPPKYMGRVQSPSYYGQQINDNHNNIQPLPPQQQQVLIPSAGQQQLYPTPTIVQPQVVAAPTTAEIQSAKVEDLLKQVHALKGQLPAAAAPAATPVGVPVSGGPTNINHHSSRISIGNTKETNINNISNSVAPITSKSMTSQDVGPKSSHVGNQQTAYNGSPVTTMNGEGNLVMDPRPVKKVKTHPTEEQRELKARLLELASRATASTPSEPILKYNQRTGTLERVPVDPNANLYKDKLHEALEMLNPKKLPTNKLRKVLDDEPQASPAPVYVVPARPEVQQQPTPVYVMDEGVPETEFAVAPQELMSAEPTREDVVNQVRFDLGDRLNRISDLLYFRPEFMNQLLQIDDMNELTPVESEFKRMILCNSDEQFCLQDRTQGSLPAIGHEPEFLGAAQLEPESSALEPEEFVAETPEPSYYGSEPISYNHNQQQSYSGSPSQSIHRSPSGSHQHADDDDDDDNLMYDDGASSSPTPVFAKLRSGASSSSKSYLARSSTGGARSASGLPQKRAPTQGEYAESQTWANGGGTRYPNQPARNKGQARGSQLTNNNQMMRNDYRQPSRVQPGQWQQQQQG